ncbi:Exo-beta-D-glucosaminidase precursor [Planctomycetes bacterium CA13]|uniref:Beta-mannosidase B n=1 Tax=Novipirellula herctigrandis TaxID=2527986 RepID=A0A5C5YLZ0_9BACT|nr:Exo-beta-D-glucosaminidase precursor [Planctomycetes bacterium CA13]
MNDNRYCTTLYGPTPLYGLTTFYGLMIALAFLFASGVTLADGPADNPPGDKVVLDLSGAWEMEGVLPGEGVKKLFHKVHPDCGPAHVPGDVYSDLWRVGRIDDPHVGRNGQRAKWVMDYEWWYFKSFKVPAEMNGKQIRLMFEGVDYECDAWLNGESLGSHQGAYSRFDYDVTDLVKFSTKRDRTENNLLAIRLAPPPRTFAFVCGRKYRWHGDYGSNVTPFGIWRPVRLEATGPVSIEDIYVQSELQQNRSAELSVQITLRNNSYAKRDLTLDVVVQGDNFSSPPVMVSANHRSEPGESVCTIPLSVEDPKLWTTWDLGDQNLYRVEVSVHDDSGFQDQERQSFAIRKLEMAMNPGWSPEEVEYPWTVMLNGQRHYMRSACWGGPPDMFTGRATEAMYREYIRLAKEANINNLRIFCWHPPEIPLFYRLCDEAGITVWQDFSLSHYLYPRDRETIEKIFDESIEVVKQIRNNPSVIFLSGGEEILYTQSDDDSDFFLQLITELERAVAPYHAIQWVPTCPLSWPNVQKAFKPRESIHAHAPHYGAGSRMLEDYYSSLEYAFVPELAITSCPSVESIRKFIPEDEVWPPGPGWGYHWADLDILRIHNYEVFGEQRIDGLERFVDATQIAQGVYFQYSGEHFRRMKPKNSGVSFCHLMLHTPDMKWAIVDFYLQPKKSFEYVRRTFQPLLVSLQHDKRRWNPGETFGGQIWVVNDLFKEFPNCTVAIRFLDDQKRLFHEETQKIGDVSADSATEFSQVSVKVPGKRGEKFYVEMQLLDDRGKVVSENEYFFLVDDQQQAADMLKAMGQEARRRTENGGGTIRYFEELQGERYVPTKLIEDFR